MPARLLIRETRTLLVKRDSVLLPLRKSGLVFARGMAESLVVCRYYRGAQGRQREDQQTRANSFRNYCRVRH